METEQDSLNNCILSNQPEENINTESAGVGIKVAVGKKIEESIVVPETKEADKEKLANEPVEKEDAVQESQNDLNVKETLVEVEQIALNDNSLEKQKGDVVASSSNDVNVKETLEEVVQLSVNDDNLQTQKEEVASSSNNGKVQETIVEDKQVALNDINLQTEKEDTASSSTDVNVQESFVEDKQVTLNDNNLQTEKEEVASSSNNVIGQKALVEEEQVTLDDNNLQTEKEDIASICYDVIGQETLVEDEEIILDDNNLQTQKEDVASSSNDLNLQEAPVEDVEDMAQGDNLQTQNENIASSSNDLNDQETLVEDEQMAPSDNLQTQNETIDSRSHISDDMNVQETLEEDEQMAQGDVQTQNKDIASSSNDVDVQETLVEDEQMALSDNLQTQNEDIASSSNDLNVQETLVEDDQMALSDNLQTQNKDVASSSEDMNGQQTLVEDEQMALSDNLQTQNEDIDSRSNDMNVQETLAEDEQITVADNNLQTQKEGIAASSETDMPMQTNEEEIVVIEIEDEEEDQLNNYSCSQAVQEYRIESVEEEKNENSVFEFNSKIQQAAQMAIRDLCKKIVGKDAAIELVQTADVNHSNFRSPPGSDENNITKDKVQTPEEYKENLEMQQIVQTAISGFFKKSFRCRRTYQFNNNSGSLPGSVTSGNIGIINENLTGRFLIQPIVDTVLTAIPKKTIENILKQVNTLTPAEYMLLHLKLSLLKYSETGESPEESVSELENKSEMQWNKAKYSQMQHILEPSLSQSSKDIIKTIVNKAAALTPAQYLFLHFNLPKGHPNVRDRCRLIPVRCMPAINQSIMWLITHFEENPVSILPKQIMYDKYYDFCERSQLKPLGTSDLGKMIKQMYPSVKPKRQVINGKAQYCYSGLQRRFQLYRPSLPKLSNKSQVKEDVLFSCHECCTVLKNMHNPRNRIRHPKEQVKKGSAAAVFTNDPVAVSTTVVPVEEEQDGFFKSSTVDGKAILVHDPLELLSLTMNDESNDHANNVACEVVSSSSDEEVVESSEFERYYDNNKPATSKTQLSNHSKLMYASKSRLKSSVSKVKFKQYMHPSIQRTFKNFKNIILPCELYQLNINPVVIINNNKLNNWCAEDLQNRIRKLSNLVITRIDKSTNFKVTCVCCNDVSEVTQEQGQQLSDLKNQLSNIGVRKIDSLNYFVTYTLPKEEVLDLKPRPSYNNTVCVNKKLFGKSLEPYKSTTCRRFSTLRKLDKIAHKLINQHPSVEKVFKQFDNITLPEEVFKSDIDPVIVLDSGEVCDWYEEQLNNVKRKLLQVTTAKAVHSYESKSLRSKNVPFRQSRAKMMNFCESDSDSCDDNLLKQGNILKNALSETSQHNVTIPQVCIPEEEETNLKRSRTDEIDEIVLKKRKLYCSKIVINGSDKPEETGNSLACTIVTGEHFEVPTLKDTSELVCGFCLKECITKKGLMEHTRIHLYCRYCKKKFKTAEAMRQHLINHCTLNNLYNKPFLQLHRIDHLLLEPNLKINSNVRQNTVSLIDRTHPRSLLKVGNHRTYKNMRPNPADGLNSSNVEEVLLPVARNDLNESEESRPVIINSFASDCGQQANSYLQIVESPRGDMAQYEIATSNQANNILEQGPQLAPPGQLKNTISNNFNRIFLLSNNMAQSQTQQPNVVYGVYLNNSNEQSSPTICLTNTSNTYSAPDCALSMNRLSNSTESTTNFMQIVESPSTTMTEFAPPVVPDNSRVTSFQHHDHSYYQQEPAFQANNLNSLNRVVLLNSMAQNELQMSDFEMPYINNINTEIPPPLEPLSNSTNTSESSNPPPPLPGQFRIRVKDIRELS